MADATYIIPPEPSARERWIGRVQTRLQIVERLHQEPDPLPCPQCQHVMRWIGPPRKRAARCTFCRLRLRLSADQTKTLADIQMGGGPGCSSASYLAELALLALGVTPVGY